MIQPDLPAIATELRALFPSLPVGPPLAFLGSGFNSLVVQAGERMVFRIARNSTAQRGYQKEKGCLPLLAPRLPIRVPVPACYVKKSAYFPFGVIGYEKIAGMPLNPPWPGNAGLDRLAGDTASFLFALQRIPVDTLPLEGPVDPHSKWSSLYREVLPTLQAGLTAAEFKSIEQWWDSFLADKTLQAYEPVIQHGDLWYENMLVNPDRSSLAGIVDWEKVCIGDPAQDFATLLHISEDFLGRVLRAYRSLGGRLDRKLAYRTQRLWEAREFDGLEYAIQFDDPIELKDTFRKLRHGPILCKALDKTIL